MISAEGAPAFDALAPSFSIHTDQAVAQPLRSAQRRSSSRARANVRPSAIERLLKSTMLIAFRAWAIAQYLSPS